ncbi:MAG: MATE family efflux transporter [Candidatus Cellulosilyticum pullistercoris]|uniref:Probable multidrug resistance protein NorM n=1 Tax=Candidatus Cellulosilyticum pullistercoris TaxID=2838521 RepID=A0A9E2NKM8_9FIRM|nr:MATE family efflux transporter [Candidatus Cellulosilyticum pullistercoris]
MARKYNRDMILSGNLTKAILTLSIPVIFNSLIQTMYNLTDTFWLGKIGTEHMAAITLVSPIQSIVVNFGTGITAAGAILIAQYVGAKDEDNANRMVGQLFSCAMLFSIICSLACMLTTPSIVRWLGAEGNVYTYGKTYLQIVIMDMPFLFMINLFSAVNQAQGDTVRPLLLNIVGVVLNMILDPLFMVVMGWGITGAALATLLAKVPCALIAFYSLIKASNPIHINLKNLKFEKKKIMQIIKIGLPTAVGGSTMQFGFLLMSKNVLAYGPIAVAAYGIGNRVNGLITTASNAMGSATSTIVGQNAGAGQYERADKGYRLARNMIVVFLLIGGIILSREAIAAPIVKIFSSDEEVIRLGMQYLVILAIYCWTNGVYNTTMGLFQGTGHTMITMAIDASRLWIFRFVTLYICESVLHLGVQSVWYSVVISNALSALALYILYHTKIWRRNNISVEV